METHTPNYTYIYYLQQIKNNYIKKNTILSRRVKISKTERIQLFLRTFRMWVSVRVSAAGTFNSPIALRSETNFDTRPHNEIRSREPRESSSRSHRYVAPLVSERTGSDKGYTQIGLNLILYTYGVITNEFLKKEGTVQNLINNFINQHSYKSIIHLNFSTHKKVKDLTQLSQTSATSCKTNIVAYNNSTKYSYTVSFSSQSRIRTCRRGVKQMYVFVYESNLVMSNWLIHLHTYRMCM